LSDYFGIDAQISIDYVVDLQRRQQGTVYSQAAHLKIYIPQRLLDDQNRLFLLPYLEFTPRKINVAYSLYFDFKWWESLLFRIP